jgi:hypothetical protein
MLQHLNWPNFENRQRCYQYLIQQQAALNVSNQASHNYGLSQPFSVFQSDILLMKTHSCLCQMKPVYSLNHFHLLFATPDTISNYLKTISTW